MICRFLVLACLLTLTACLDMGMQRPAPVTTYGQSSGPGSAGVHNVIAGDTIYSVATSYRLPMRDIVILNHIQAPFRLREGQRLKLPPPQEYTARAGDTIYDVSRLFDVKSSEIARINNLGPPYSLRQGQVLRLPSLSRRYSQKSALALHVTPPKKPVQGAMGHVASVEREVLENPLKDAPKVTVESHSVSLTPPKKPPAPTETQGMRVIERVTAKVPPRSSGKFLRPVEGKLISDFGPKKTGLHNDGVNIAARKGTPVKAAENGVVVYAGNELKGSGNLVLIRHEDQWVTAYAHMESISIRKGDIVKRGQKIGSVGSTGNVDEPQLHFEIRRGTDAINPKKYIDH